MPTYEYACQACGHAWEEIQRMSDPTLDTCPKCGEKRALRLISQGNFILKGGGWYTTGGYGAPAKARSEDAPAVPAKAPSTAPDASPSNDAPKPAAAGPVAASSDGGKSAPSTPSTPSASTGESAKSTPSTAPAPSKS